VDYTGSISYNTSRFLADILNPLIGKTEQFVKNSKHLAEELSNIHICEQCASNWDIKFNPDKNQLIMFGDKNQYSSKLYLNSSL